MMLQNQHIYTDFVLVKHLTPYWIYLMEFKKHTQLKN